MKKLHLAVAMAIACLSVSIAHSQTVVLPQVKNAGGSNVPSQASVLTASDGTEKGTVANPMYIAGSTGGDASAANQAAVQAAAGSDATKAVAVQGITNGKALAVSAAALPLPTGAATSSLQTRSTPRSPRSRPLCMPI